MINMWKITNKNKNIPLTNKELESILQDKQFYDLFDDENIGSVIDSDHESIGSYDSDSVTEVTDNDDISDRNDKDNSDDAFLERNEDIDREGLYLSTNQETFEGTKVIEVIVSSCKNVAISK
ncbi:hypothetical protein FQA39_LY07466 [Lamprigera yunnana]|nr:hypothetical protein FQA39_LY07466 [Lamprigera yunnana]